LTSDWLGGLAGVDPLHDPELGAQDLMELEALRA